MAKLCLISPYDNFNSLHTYIKMQYNFTFELVLVILLHRDVIRIKYICFFVLLKYWLR